MSGERVSGAGGGFGTSFTDELLLSGAESVNLSDVRPEIRKIDREKMLEE